MITEESYLNTEEKGHYASPSLDHLPEMERATRMGTARLSVNKAWKAALATLKDPEQVDEETEKQRTCAEYVAHWTREPTPEEQKALSEIVQMAYKQMDTERAWRAALDSAMEIASRHGISLSQLRDYLDCGTGKKPPDQAETDTASKSNAPSVPDQFPAAQVDEAESSQKLADEPWPYEGVPSEVHDLFEAIRPVGGNMPGDLAQIDALAEEAWPVIARAFRGNPHSSTESKEDR